jgi:MarR family transcriptional regulator, lower aerobic nicotinate degradation pathway regulator
VYVAFSFATLLTDVEARGFHDVQHRQTVLIQKRIHASTRGTTLKLGVDMAGRSAPKKMAETAWVGNLDKQVGFLLRKASQRNLTLFQKHSPVASLTSVQAASLIVLIDQSPCSLTTLGRAAAMDPATTRGVAERLSEKGWVSLVADSKDKRKVMVKLEKKGRQFALDLIPILHAIAAETLEPLNEAEQVALVYLLGKIGHGP